MAKRAELRRWIGRAFTAAARLPPKVKLPDNARLVKTHPPAKTATGKTSPAKRLSVNPRSGKRPGKRAARYAVDPRVDAYLETLPGWQRDVCQRIRDLVHAADPELIDSSIEALGVEKVISADPPITATEFQQPPGAAGNSRPAREWGQHAGRPAGASARTSTVLRHRWPTGPASVPSPGRVPQRRVRARRSSRPRPLCHRRRPTWRLVDAPGERPCAWPASVCRRGCCAGPDHT